MLIEGIFLFCWLITRFTTPARIGFQSWLRPFGRWLCRRFYVFSVEVISIMTGLVVSQKIAAFQDLINVPDRLIIAVQIPPLWMKCIFPEAG
jgi:hypothetical protein